MNEALMISSVRQHELTEQSQQHEAAMRANTDLLRQSHAIAESIVATVREPLLVLDEDLRVQSASRSFYDIFRAVPEDTVNRPLYELGNRQWDIPDLRRLLNEVLPRDNQVTDFEMVHEFEQIGRKTMRLNARRLIQAADQAPLILLAIEDVTESEAVQKAVRESERRYREMIDAIPAAVYTADAEGHLTHFNPAAIEFAGRTPELGTDQWCVSWKLYHPDGTPLPHDECPTAIALKEGRVVSGVEAIVEQPDGNRVWGMLYPALLRDAAGRVTGAITMVVDITQRKQMEEKMRDITVRRQTEQALRESQSRLGHAANAARLTYVEVDFARGGARTAENFAAVMGYASPPQQEADVSIGTRLLLEHVVPHDRLGVEAKLQDFLDGKPVGKIEYRVLGDDQIERWIESAWSMELGPNGKPLKTFATNLDITERKLAEDALRESEERYRNLFNSIDEGYCIIEMIFDEREKPVDWRFLEVNPAFEKQTGLQDAMGKRVRELLPTHEPYWFEIYGKVALTGEPVRFVNEAKELEGRWFDLYAFRIGEPNSRKVAVLFKDISEQRRNEEALRESEERYRNLFNSIDEGFCVIEMIFDERERPVDYRFLDVNPTFERQTGLREAVGKRALQLVPDLEAYWPEIFGEVATTGEPRRFSKEVQAMNLWLDVYACRIGGPDSRKLAVVFNDTTERRQSEEALRQSEQRLRFVMDSMPQKIFTAKPNGDLDYFNPQWTEFTGLTFEQMEDSGWTRFVHPDDLAEKTQNWLYAFNTGEPFQSEHRFRRADGEYRWHFSRAVPMRDEAGRITMWVGSNTDVHDIKLVEAVLQEQAAELSDLHRRKDEFLAMLSHELRSPLAPIANALQLLSLQQGSESQIQHQARGVIERQMRQLQHLVDDLLEVSRITSGKVQLRLEQVAVSDIILGAVETVLPLIEQRRHELTVSLSQEPIWLHADAARLQQVLVNLLTNAAKYTEEGGHVWLTVEEVVSGECRVASDEKDKSRHTASALATHHSPLATPHVVIRVRDTGSGIAAELLPHIFDIFTQAERSLDRSQGGLGIGLALVQRLTVLHGGSVEASSVLGQGSEFIVRLPLLPRDIRPSLVTETRSPTTRSLRVLVVDDNVDAAESLGMLLQVSGHDVWTAYDGLAALQSALHYKPDVVFLDIGLPKMNGYEVAKQIRQQPDLENVVLIALTGYGQDTDRQASLQAGFNHHLVKPAPLEQLLQILSRLIALKDTPDE